MTQPDESRVVGRVPFVDGATRDVYEDADGRQWVSGHDETRVLSQGQLLSVRVAISREHSDQCDDHAAHRNDEQGCHEEGDDGEYYVEPPRYQLPKIAGEEHVPVS